MITSQGISLKRKGTRKGFNWKQLEALKGAALDVGGESVPWEDVQAELDEADIDLASKEIQDKIAVQEQTIQDMEPTQEEKDRRDKLNQLRSEIRSNPAPNSMPELSKRVEKIEQVLGLRDLEL